MGGSITDTTRAVVAYRPSSSSPRQNGGSPASTCFKTAPRAVKPCCSSSDGAEAPWMVSHSSSQSKRNIAPAPVMGRIRIRSSRRSHSGVRAAPSVTAWAIRAARSAVCFMLCASSGAASAAS